MFAFCSPLWERNVRTLVPDPLRFICQIPTSFVAVDNRTNLSDDKVLVRASEFIRKVEKLGDVNGVVVQFKPRRGKGSHGTLFYGDKLTIVTDRKRDLKSGTLHGMLKQLGIRAEDL